MAEKRAGEAEEVSGAKRTKAASESPLDEAIGAYVDAHSSDYVARLSELVAIPGVSMEPGRRSEVRRAVLWVKAWCEKLGGAARLEELGEETLADGSKLQLPPALLAQFGEDPSKKTLLVYGHLDVQPAKLSDGWATEPFTLVEKGGALYGRGATDDKGPMTGWLWVVEAYAALGRPLPVNLRCIFEGMEEAGSKGLPELCRRLSHPGGFLDPSAVDFVSISDNYWTGKNKPCLTHGLRGNVYFHLEVRCSRKDLHSGVIGGSVHEAMTDCVRLMASLVDSSGRILVDGVCDDVAPLTEREREMYARVDFDVEDYKKDAGVDGVTDKLLHETKEEVLMHRWRYPTLSLHGIEGAFDGPGSKTVIPACVVGKFSMRIVPDMQPERVEALVRGHVERELKKLGSPNVVKLTVQKASTAWYREPDHPAFRAAAAATVRVHGMEPCFTREGGSIPITEVLEEVCDAVCVHLPIGASDDGAHSQNEKIDLSNYLKGIKVFAAYLDELALLPPEPDAPARAAAAAAAAARLASNRWRKRCKVQLFRHGCVTSQFKTVMAQLNATTDSIAPLQFVMALRQRFPRFAEMQNGGYMQQDADECLRGLLTVLSGTMLTANGGNKVDELFGFKLQSTLKCLECDEEPPQTTEDLNRVLLCHLGTQTDPVSHIHQGVQLSLKEHIEKNSPVLGRNAQYEKSSRISSLPPYLVVQFARFGYKGANDWAGTSASKVKLTRKCSFSHTFDVFDCVDEELKKRLSLGRVKKKEQEDEALERERQELKKAKSSSSSAPAEDADVEMKPAEDVEMPGLETLDTGYYQLVSIVSHKGRTADGGHYVGWTLHKKADGKELKKDKWVLFDDDTVSFCDWEDMVGLSTDLQGGKADTQIAYINIYKKVTVTVSGQTLGQAEAAAPEAAAPAEGAGPAGSS